MTGTFGEEWRFAGALTAEAAGCGSGGLRQRRAAKVAGPRPRIGAPRRSAPLAAASGPLPDLLKTRPTNIPSPQWV